MIRNLGRVLTILIEAEVAEHSMHADVDAWGAPSECHRDVSRNEAKRLREARKHAEAVARRPLRIIKQEALKRGALALGGGPGWDRAFGRIYSRHGFPF